MKKTIFTRANLTGRKFICIGTDSEYVENFSEFFKMGSNYYEAITDSDGINSNDKGSLLIKTDNDIVLYVEADNFILVEEKINKIALEPFCKN